MICETYYSQNKTFLIIVDVLTLEIIGIIIVINSLNVVVVGEKNNENKCALLNQYELNIVAKR